MKLKCLHQIITIIFLCFVCLPSALAQPVDGNNTTIVGTTTGNVCGNTDGIDVLCTGPNVPGAGDSRDVTNNQITVESGAKAYRLSYGGVYGGYSLGGGNVTDNTVNIRGYADAAFGGYQESNSGTGVVARNTVIVSNGGIVDLDAYGGYGYSGDIAYNKVIVEIGGTVNENVVGGNTNRVHNVIGNMVDIKGKVGRNVYGGTVYMAAGDIRENTIKISGTVDGGVYGGQTTGWGAVVGNVVIVEVGGTVGTDVQVGVTLRGGNMIDNMADIRGTVARDVYGGITLGGSYVGGNKISVSGSVGRNVGGGQTTDSGAVIGNVVTIENGGIIGGNSYGGISFGTGEVSGNTVNVSGSVGGDVVGGYGSNTSSCDIADNTVNLYQGATITGDVFGGYGASASSGDITNNTVNLYQGAAITGGVYGGVSLNTGPVLVSGNTLNVRQFRGSVAEINAFQNYNFDLPLGLYAGDTLITITGTTPTDLTNSDIAVSNQFSVGAFKATGDQIILIDQANGSFTTSFSGIGYGGLSEVYSLSLHDNSNALVIEANGVTVNPQTKSLSQGLMSEIVTLNRATDLITELGVEQAKASLKKQSEGPAFFTTFSYADTRTKTGSHIDSDGWAGLMGLAWDEGTIDNTGWLASVYIEGGHGDWNAYNSFANHSSVHSYGDTDYIGAGVLGLYRFENRMRLEASARFGHVESDYTARGYAGGLRPEFDLSGMYYSAHVGLGYDLDLNDKLKLDMTAKYLWTIRKGESVSTLGERIHFDDINSHRVRAGGRLTYEAALGFQTYVGLYGEYEFDGESQARNLTTNIKHDPTKIKGGTGIGELGVSITPENIKNFNVGLSLQGHAGRRDGVVGNVALSWKF